MSSLPKVNIQRLLTTLDQLLRIDSPTGDTAAIEHAMCERLAPFGWQVSQTHRGNVLAQSGDNPKRVIAAHLDTLGAMVQFIRDDGRLEVTPLGTWSARFAEGARVTVKTRQGPIRASLLPLLSSGHAWNDAVDTQPIAWSQLSARLDRPTSSREETLALGVQPGDIVSIDPAPEFDDSGYLISRFLDNKAGIACVLEMLYLLQENKLTPAQPVILAFTNAEEIGLGAGTALPRAIEELISVDIAPVANNQASREDCATLGYKDALGPHSRALLDRLDRIATEHQVSFIRDVFRHYHSDCSSTLTAGYDASTALVGFGTDSTHGYERTHQKSLIAVTQLLTGYVLSS
ncbi:M20/M25/M40 family metallo-hydrolase [Saccharospirillum alexandrii]|uniref:M20/M25/M40 family metallo-hydrolase n=1 Tax=Saccharospirillum alexandrii TaxID=2448477 RepID=UPI003735CF53